MSAAEPAFNADLSLLYTRHPVWLAAWLRKKLGCPEHAAELARYRKAPIRCAPEAAPLRVSGVLQPNRHDPAAHALAALERTLPVTVAAGSDGVLTIRRK